jgi:mannose-1-phosphate guanylyltransferase
MPLKIDAEHIILAGGSGTRFWPVSRSGRPKQFLSLIGGRPLLRQAFDRASAMSGAGRVWVAAGAAQRALVRQVLPELPDDRFVGEPVARNTAPSVGLAALMVSRIDPEAVLVMAPADHVYAHEDRLAAALSTAVQAARSTGALVTLGIRPLRPDTGYGYIEASGAAAEEGAPSGVLKASRFVEKPDAATAARYLAQGTFYWNSGLFVWSARSILEAIRDCAPEVWAPLESLARHPGFPHDATALESAFAAMPSISIDYAVLERAPRVLVVPTDPGWSDVGSWDAVAEMHPPGADGNAAAGEPGGVLAAASRGCFVFREGSRREVALVGVEDLLVVDTGEALLVCRRGDSQRVREIVEALRARGRTDLL